MLLREWRLRFLLAKLSTFLMQRGAHNESQMLAAFVMLTVFACNVCDAYSLYACFTLSCCVCDTYSIRMLTTVFVMLTYANSVGDDYSVCDV